MNIDANCIYATLILIALLLTYHAIHSYVQYRMCKHVIDEGRVIRIGGEVVVKDNSGTRYLLEIYSDGAVYDMQEFSLVLGGWPGLKLKEYAISKLRSGVQL